MGPALHGAGALTAAAGGYGPRALPLRVGLPMNLRDPGTIIAAALLAAGGLTALLPPAGAALQPPVAAAVERLLEHQDYAGALSLLDAAPERAAGGPALLRLRAEALVGLLDYSGAVAALRELPGDPAALALRIRLLAMLGRDAEARAAVDLLVAPGGDRAPLEPEPRRELAAQLRASGLIAEAERVLGVPADDEGPVLRLERGRLLLAMDNVAGALPVLEAAARAPDPPAGAAYELGRCLALLGRRDEAVTWLRRAVAEGGGDRAARFRLGQLLLQAGDTALVEEGQRLLAGYEAHRLRERRRGLLFTMAVGGSAPGAAETGARDRGIWVQLLGLLLDAAGADAGEREEAARVLAAAAGRFPGDPAFAIGRARLLLLEGDPRGAAAVLAPLVPPAPAPLSDAALSAARWLGEAHLRGGAPAPAAAVFDRVLAAAGDAASPRVISAAATAFAMNGDPERALVLFDRIAADVAAPDRAGPLADGALALEMLGRTADAETRYRAALAADPTHVAAAAGLFDLLRRTGRPTEAEAILIEALRHNPGNETLTTLPNPGP